MRCISSSIKNRIEVLNNFKKYNIDEKYRETLKENLKSFIYMYAQKRLKTKEALASLETINISSCSKLS